MLPSFATGLAVGLLTGIPLGPSSAAVVDTAIRHSRRKAMALGAGAALVDFLYCLAATLGFGALLQERQQVAEILRLGGSVLLAAMGLAMLLRHPPDPGNLPVRRTIRAGTLLAAGGTGFLISGLNPALATTWILLSGTVFAGFEASQAVAASLGVFLGCGGWFVAVALAAHRGRQSLGRRAVWINRVAGGALVLYGVAMLLRPILLP